MITVTLDFDPPFVPAAVRTTAVATAAGTPVPGLSYPIAWTAGASGTWSFAFPEVEGATGYVYTAVATYAGVDTAPFEGEVAGTPGVPVTVTTRVAAAMRARFRQNVRAWSADGPNSNGTLPAEDSGNVEASAAYAVGQVQDHFHVTLSATTSDGVIDNVAMLGVAEHLYAVNGLRDAGDKVAGHLTKMQETAWERLEAVFRDNAAAFGTQDGGRVPGAGLVSGVYATVDAMGRPITPTDRAGGVYHDPMAGRYRWNGYGQ